MTEILHTPPSNGALTTKSCPSLLGCTRQVSGYSGAGCLDAGWLVWGVAALYLVIGGSSVETENGEERSIETPLLLGCEVAGEVAETLQVDGADLFDENASSRAVYLDFGPKRGRLGANGRRRHQHDRTREEGIGLHNDTKTASSLLTTDTLR